MVYDIKLAGRIREYLNAIPNVKIEERKMFGGLAFYDNLFDEVIGRKSSRQHKFDFLFGDSNEKGIAARLPVDAYYETFETCY